MDQELDTGLRSITPQLIRSVENSQHSLRYPQVFGLRNKVIQFKRHFRHDRKAPPGHDPKPSHLFPINYTCARKESEIMNIGNHTISIRTTKSHLKFSWQQLRKRVSHKITNKCPSIGRRIKDLVGGDAAPWVPGHITHRVPASLTGGKTGSTQDSN